VRAVLLDGAQREDHEGARVASQAGRLAVGALGQADHGRISVVTA
jgi:hypothetical protein